MGFLIYPFLLPTLTTHDLQSKRSSSNYVQTSLQTSLQTSPTKHLNTYVNSLAMYCHFSVNSLAMYTSLSPYTNYCLPCSPAPSGSATHRSNTSHKKPNPYPT